MKKHLICLVGTNPLPIWVTCINLKEEFSEGTLLYTEAEGVGNNARKLQKELENEGLKFKLQVIDKSDPRKIRNTLSNVIDGLVKTGVEHIELSYTGGTKAMAVYSWETLTSKGKEKGLKVGANYLDSKSHQIIGDDGLVKAFDARKGCSVDLDRMIRLHGYSKEEDKKNISESRKEMGAKFGGCVLKNRDTFGAYRRWKDSEYKLEPEFFVFTEDEDFWVQFLSDTKIKDFKNVWLEGYAAMHLSDAIERIREKRGGKEYFPAYEEHIGVRVKMSCRSAPEFDVIGIIGYQLILISCSTSEKEKEIKLKAFEALTRARQLGGDEAQAIMISLLECTKAKEIEDDLKDDIGGAEPPLRVWGVDKLWDEELINYLEEYIETLTEL